MKYNLALELAEELSLDRVEVTSGRNGYPENLQAALVGFETFEDAERVANEHHLEVVRLHRRDGWQLYESKGREFSAMSPDSSWYGDDYATYKKMDKEDFYQEFIQPFIEDISSLDDLKALVEEREKLWDEFEEMEETELLITCEGRHYETIEEHPMQWSYDTHNYIIAVM